NRPRNSGHRDHPDGRHRQPEPTHADRPPTLPRNTDRAHDRQDGYGPAPRGSGGESQPNSCDGFSGGQHDRPDRGPRPAASRSAGLSTRTLTRWGVGHLGVCAVAWVLLSSSNRSGAVRGVSGSKTWISSAAAAVWSADELRSARSAMSPPGGEVGDGAVARAT